MRCLPPRLAASLPAVVLAVFVLGGLVAPDLHRASHAAEWAAERAVHAASHADAGDALDTPCPPAVADLDCALCAGLSLAAPATVVQPCPDVRRAPAPPAQVAAAESRPTASARPRGPPSV